MPELPEVEVVRAGLEPALVGARVTEVVVSDDRGITRHDPAIADFTASLDGATFSSVERRGKFLWAPLASADLALVGHLGMSGQMLLRPADAPTERHERVRLAIEHPMHGRLTVLFVDQRTFGSLAVDRLHDGVPSQVAHIARDALDPLLDEAEVVRRIRAKRSAVKRILLDQTLISGIGNIYADEALWAARVHHETLGIHMSAQRIRLLLTEVRAVLNRALAEGGTSFDAQYVNVNGQAGRYASALNVYGRNSQDCSRCGNTITRIRFMGRYSHLCLVCQRKRG